MDDLLGDPAPQVVAVELSGSGVVLEIRFWVAPPARGEAVELTDDVLRAVKTALGEAGIRMSDPTQQVVVHPCCEHGSAAVASGSHPRTRASTLPSP